MNNLEALILGVIQGLTEFLPVSSSGHIELGKAILGVDVGEDLTFTLVVHGATVLSTIFVFWKDILALLTGIFSPGWNPEKAFASQIAISMIPVLIIGLFFRDAVEAFFTGNVLLVGSMLILTGLLLAFAWKAPSRGGKLTWMSALLIGISQAIAVIPGLSRSGATISTALILGIDREQAARFSFLMVLVPIIGANILDMKDMGSSSSVGTTPLLIGFIAAFVTGVLACRLMVGIVKRGQLLWFALYCVAAGMLAVILA